MSCDVVIVGAGTAGAACALACAEAGLSVKCLDRRPLDEAGARWVNGVPRSSFDEAGVSQPEGAELRGAGHPFHILAGWGPRRISIRGHELLDVDMRLLVRRLGRLAQEAGAELLGEVSVQSFDGRVLRTSAGRFEPSWVVDASGLNGANLAGQRPVDRRDVCAAAQWVHRVKARDRARAFFAAHRTSPGETLCFTGVAGGFSVLNARLDDEGISLLTGSIPADGHVSGSQLLQRFVEEHDFIGEPLFGGARAIPLRRPLDRLASARVALIGDAACQVFSAHGSGIGAGMVAARMLAEELAAGRTPWDYSVRWQRRYGGLFAAYDVFRRFSQTLSMRDIDQLMAAGLLDEAAARAGLEQRTPTLALGELPRKARGLAQASGLTRRLAPVAAKMVAAYTGYARYPRREAALPRWSRAMRRVLG